MPPSSSLSGVNEHLEELHAAAWRPCSRQLHINEGYLKRGEEQPEERTNEQQRAAENTRKAINAFKSAFFRLF